MSALEAKGVMENTRSGRRGEDEPDEGSLSIARPSPDFFFKLPFGESVRGGGGTGDMEEEEGEDEEEEEGEDEEEEGEDACERGSGLSSSSGAIVS